MVKVLFPPTTKTIEQMSIIKKVWNTIVLGIVEMYECITASSFGIILFWLVIFLLIFGNSSCKLELSIHSTP